MPKVRYPLAQAFMSRDGSLGSKDAFVKNGLIDKYLDKHYTIKRPGTTTFQDLGVTGTAQGAFYFNGFVYEVINDVLYRSSGTLNSGTNATAFTSAPTPSWIARTENQTLVFDDRMWIIGPGSQPNTTATGEVWYTQDGLKWALATSGIGAARLGHRCCVFNNAMWMMGGRVLDSSRALNDVLTSTDGVTWTEVIGVAPWPARQHFGLIAANNGMYLFGGSDTSSGNFNDVWFSTDGVTWVQISTGAGWAARNSFGYAFYNNRLVLTGGVAGATFYNDAWTSVDGILWVQATAAAFSTGRFGNQMVVYAGAMYSIGGERSLTTQVADIYRSTDYINWTLVTTTPGFSPRVNAMATVYRTPLSVSPYRYETIWVMAGGPNFAEFQDVWYGNLNIQTLISYALNPTITGQQYQFSTYLNGTQLVLKNQSNFWVLASSTLTKVTDPNYPPTTVPGISVLNSFVYVTTPEGEIHACKINDALLWPALQFTIADYEDDPAIAEKKYLNYIVVFGQYTIQFFYDNANPAPGISISPYTGANLRVGLAYAATLQELQNTLIWVGQTINHNLTVYIFNGMSPQSISVSWVDKVINQNINSGVTCYVSGAEGHTFYVLNFSALNYSLVYDFNMKQWYVWSSAFGALPYIFALTTFNFGGDLLIGYGVYSGQIHQTNATLFQDVAGPFDFLVQTDKIDGDTLQRKFASTIDVVGDVSPATVKLSWSDDDYASWSYPVFIDMDNMRPRRNRLGSFRRRSYRLLQTDNNPARWEALEMTFSENEIK